MNYLSVENISNSFGERTFENIFEINKDQKNFIAQIILKNDYYKY
jgi:hypothetical protein